MDELDSLIQAAEAEVAAAGSTAELAAIETRYLGSKGNLQAQLRSIGSLPREDRPTFGARINAAKQGLSERIDSRRAALSGGEKEARLAAESIDITLPGRPIPT